MNYPSMRFWSRCAAMAVLIPTTLFLVGCIGQGGGSGGHAGDSDRVSPVDGTPPHRRFVDASARPGGNGHNWQRAFRSLDEGLAAAAADHRVTELWVAEGTYHPGAGGFRLVPGLRVVGGFRSGQKNKEKRDPAAAPTVLDGLLPDGSRALHVVTAADGAVLDGVVITGGGAHGEGGDSRGGGLIVDGVAIEIRQCRVESNSAASIGGGISVVHGSLTAIDCVIANNQSTEGAGIHATDAGVVRADGCRFIGNAARQLGGGIGSNVNGEIVLMRSEFTDNFALEHGGGIWIDTGRVRATACALNHNVSRWGGGVSVYRASVLVASSVFVANRATYFNDFLGGAAINSHEGDGPLRAINCTFLDNISIHGVGTVLGNAVDDLYANCLFWGNRAGGSGANAFVYDGTHGYRHCLFEGSFDPPWFIGGGAHIDLGGNLAGVDPQFADGADALGYDLVLGTPDDGLHLLSTSPAIAAGDPAVLPADVDDLDDDGDTAEPLPIDACGEARLSGGTIAIGAYQTAAPSANG